MLFPTNIQVAYSMADVESSPALGPDVIGYYVQTDGYYNLQTGKLEGRRITAPEMRDILIKCMSRTSRVAGMKTRDVSGLRNWMFPREGLRAVDRDRLVEKGYNPVMHIIGVGTAVVWGQHVGTSKFCITDVLTLMDTLMTIKRCIGNGCGFYDNIETKIWKGKTHATILSLLSRLEAERGIYGLKTGHWTSADGSPLHLNWKSPVSGVPFDLSLVCDWSTVKATGSTADLIKLFPGLYPRICKTVNSYEVDVCGLTVRV